MKQLLVGIIAAGMMASTAAAGPIDLQIQGGADGIIQGYGELQVGQNDYIDVEITGSIFSSISQSVLLQDGETHILDVESSFSRVYASQYSWVDLIGGYEYGIFNGGEIALTSDISITFAPKYLVGYGLSHFEIGFGLFKVKVNGVDIDLATPHTLSIGDDTLLVEAIRSGYNWGAIGAIGGFMLTNVTEPVPEPMTMILFGLGMIGIAASEKRKRRHNLVA